MLAREVLYLRGIISRKTPWDVMPDLYFFRKPEETYPTDWNTTAVAPQTTGYEASAAQDWDAQPEVTPATADWSASEVPQVAAAEQDWGAEVKVDDWGASAPPPAADWGAQPT